VELALLVERRVVGSPLAGEAHPGVEAGARRGVVAHVPLAEEGRLVAARVQGLGEGLQAVAQEVAGHVVDHTVARRVLPGEDAGPVRRAQRHRVEGPGEEGTFTGQPVAVRGFEVGMAGGAELVPAQIVDDDDDEVGALVGAGGPRRGRRDECRQASHSQQRQVGLSGPGRAVRAVSRTHGWAEPTALPATTGC
jgi:hypothetical protein